MSGRQTVHRGAILCFFYLVNSFLFVELLGMLSKNVDDHKSGQGLKSVWDKGCFSVLLYGCILSHRKNVGRKKKLRCDYQKISGFLSCISAA